MGIRRSSSGKRRECLSVSWRDFAWDPAVLALLDHSTIPSEELFSSGSIDAISLTEALPLGSRDALSIVAQYAAHQVVLRAAGVFDRRFEPSEWALSMCRGEDARLLRTAAHEPSREMPLWVHLVGDLASAIDAKRTPAIGQAWAKPETIFCEAHCRLRETAGDMTWTNTAAFGTVRAPGADALRAAAAGAVVICDDTASASSVSRFAATKGVRLIAAGDEASPLMRLSGVAELVRVAGAGAQSDGELTERIEAALRSQPSIVVLTDEIRLDDSSRRILSVLVSARCCGWIMSAAARSILRCSDSDAFEAGISLPVVVAPRLHSARIVEEFLAGLDERSRQRWIESFVRGGGLSSLIDRAETPDVKPETPPLAEPEKSYLAAIAILGSAVSAETASKFLARLEATLTVEEVAERAGLALDGATLVLGTRLRETLLRSLPAAVRSNLLEIAVHAIDESVDPVVAARVLVERGRTADALRCLESASARISDDALLPALLSFSRDVLLASPVLCSAIARSLNATGQYRTALAFAERANDGEREYETAFALRRLGQYEAALSAVAPVAKRSAAAALLHGELDRLVGNFDSARNWLAHAADLESTASEKERLFYERALIDFDEQRTGVENSWPLSYLGSRLRSYAAVDHDDYATAIAAARDACELAADTGQEIDARLDLVHALFAAGDWESSRHEALLLLGAIEETEGDRAAGGVLFLLAYLAADSAQWDRAEILIRKLRAFYSGSSDERRSREIALIEAHLLFSRGHLAEARAVAEPLQNARLSSEMAEAVAVLLDEIDWIEGRESTLRCTGVSRCVELDDRARLLMHRRGVAAPEPAMAFNRALAKAERGRREGVAAPFPDASTTSERLKRLRALISPLASRVSETERISALQDARELGVAIDPPEVAADTELQFLQKVATAEFPFPPQAFSPLRWRHAARNRLGQWSQCGSLEALSSEALDALLISPTADTLRSGDQALIEIEGSRKWSQATRDAAGALVRLRSEHHNLRRAMQQEREAEINPAVAIEGIVGESTTMREMLAPISRIAKSDVAACIYGESGSGKELIAAAIHRLSPRRGRPLVALNCAALPENLIESELFGHARGAFTGADREHIGVVETADGGTLFLDEIAELPSTAQAKLLRFLQEGEFRRVGETTLRRSDARIVAATNRNLEEHVDSGAFREDLYYRIAGILIRVPPLRDRGRDALLLANHFLAIERKKARGGPDHLEPDVETVVLCYRWPGNVRELQNTIRGAFALAADARVIRLEHLPQRIQQTLIVHSQAGSFFEEVLRFRRSLIERSLASTSGNQSQAARTLGMSRQALAYQIRELGILVK